MVPAPFIVVVDANVLDGHDARRGDQPFEHAVAAARQALQQSNRSTAQNEVAEALSGLSRRPTLQEGREPSAEEAELVTTVCAAVVTYLVKKHDAGSRP